MNTSFPADSDQLWALRLQLAPDLCVGPVSQSRFFIEQPADGSRYILVEWQFRLLGWFNGENTVAEGVQAILGHFPNELTEAGVREFCGWLYEEKLLGGEFSQQSAPPVAVPVLHELPVSHEPPVNPIAQSTQSALELVSLSPVPENIFNEVDAGNHLPAENESPRSKTRRSLGSGLMGTILKMAACIAVGLGSWKFTNLVYPMMNQPHQQSQSFVIAEATAEGTSAASSSAANQAIAAEIAAALPDAEDVKPAELGDYLSDLRDRLEICRERRDQFYEANDEASYRLEVQEIAVLTRKIGEVQARIRKTLGTGSDPIQF
ncbi:MAG: hypothetical protein HKN23_06245 [Verrucomicrobiales bacterium]|nr:hypothetical protein [Verrucomicrobiales bacterium]